jgi:hypothetical protein
LRLGFKTVFLGVGWQESAGMQYKALEAPGRESLETDTKIGTTLHALC